MRRVTKLAIGSIGRLSNMTDWLLRRRGVLDGLLVLTFHRVLPYPYFRAGMAISQVTFRGLLEFLARNTEVVSLEDALSSNSGRGRLRVALTFDDGYRDNFDYGLPELRRYGFPATVFVATDLVDDPSRYLWWDETAHALDSWGSLPADRLHHLLEVLGSRGISANSEDAKFVLLNRIVDHLRMQPTRDREAAVQEICAATSTGETPRPRIMLSWDEARAMAREGIAIGGHSVSHANLAELEPLALQHEIDGCRQRIREEIGAEPNAFAYPYGWYSPEAVGAAKRAGFRIALTTECSVFRQGCDLHEAPRVSMADDDLRGLGSGFSANMWHFQLWRRIR